MVKSDLPFAGFVLFLGATVFVCLCPFVGIPALVSWFVLNNKEKLKVLFCQPNGGVSMVKTEELYDMKRELEEDEEFVDPTAKSYADEVEKLLKPEYRDDPEWQNAAKGLREHVNENRKKAEAEEKEDLEREKRENNGFTEEIKEQIDEKVQKAHTQWVSGYF